MEREDISVPVPSIWVNLSTVGFLEGDKACSGNPEAHGHSSDHIHRRYLDITSGERGVDPNHNINLPNARSTGSGDQPEKVSVNPPTENGIPSGCNNIALDIPSRKAEEKTIGTTPSLQTECFSERPSKVCWQDLSLAESNMASPSSLQGNAVFDKFCDANGSVPTGWSRDKVQCHTKIHQGGREQPDLVELPRQKDPIAISINSQNTGCFQYWVGSSTKRATDRGGGPKRKPYTILIIWNCWQPSWLYNVLPNKAMV